MKIEHFGLAVLGIVALQGVASAEMISGTISGIDPQAKKLTLMRQDTQNPVTLSVKDQAQLLGLQPGNKVVVDANRKFFGGWKVESVTMSSGTSAGDEAAMNAGIRAAESAHANVNANAGPGSAAPGTTPEKENRSMNPNPTAESTY